MMYFKPDDDFLVARDALLDGDVVTALMMFGRSRSLDVRRIGQIAIRCVVVPNHRVLMVQSSIVGGNRAWTITKAVLVGQECAVNDAIRRVELANGSWLKVEYNEPDRLRGYEADEIQVDEAASLFRPDDVYNDRERIRSSATISLRTPSGTLNRLAGRSPDCVLLTTRSFDE